ncbi:DinB family protein [Streptomyces capillispiralis]|uniref:DinB family protein n=1 Tax=Streptomyces capillispiralis TaxID=68182 RepID=A0A561THC7_9ACTN|nr:DinB family protein [Streptomyces capillispiralis]TWF86527.1 DinB family protein [Streptomyces capillispiralis]GHH95251.1 DNA damage-inducible protein DinB [Streptomyces capillispiralis]
MNTPAPAPGSASAPAGRLGLLRRQFDLTWSLIEYHVERLEPEDFLWEPAPLCWTVRRSPDGSWVPDWSDTEPDPVPVPTIAWVSWHIGWWWSVTLDHARGRRPRDRADITWPGAGAPTVEWLRGLRSEWLALLDNLTDTDLDATARFPLPDDPTYTVADMLAWANAELMKNGAEIGQLRLLRAAS